MSYDKIALEHTSDIVLARRACRELARALAFSSADQTRLATAVSELARNAIQYAGAGLCVITDESDNSAAVIRVSVEDHGPGIADVDRALQPGFTTSRGLGAGLPGARRLVHDFCINSQPGHTVVQVKMKRSLEK